MRRALVAQLRALGVTPVLLSGDRRENVEAVARTLGIRDAHAALRPEDKRAAIAALQARGARVAMVGDGVNDAPALAQADVSASLGSATPLAQWTADIVVLSDRIELVAATVRGRAARLRGDPREPRVGGRLQRRRDSRGRVRAGDAVWAAVGMSVSSLAVVANALRLTRVPAEPGRCGAGRFAGAAASALESAWKS